MESFEFSRLSFNVEKRSVVECLCSLITVGTAGLRIALKLLTALMFFFKLRSTLLTIFVSSVNLSNLLITPSSRSFMNTANSRGPKMDP